MATLSSSLTIYAGAGATIDRTDFGWSSLSKELLRETFDTSNLSIELERDIGTQRLASIAIERLRGIEGDSTDARVSDILRVALYRNSSWVGGKLTESIAQLAAIRAEYGDSTSIITTNYDDFLERDLQDLKPAISVNGDTTRSTSESLVSIDYVHGRVPEEPDGLAVPLVVSESQYAETSGRVLADLHSAFSTTNALILGSSLTDPPLVRALVGTRDTARAHKLRRRVVIPKQGNRALSTPQGRQLIRDGLRHLGCEGIFTDYFCQTAQFVHEVKICAEDPEEYCHEISTARYGARIDEWWKAWAKQCEAVGFPKAQADDHQILRTTLKEVREILDAPDDERLKLELWVRWRPIEQKLRLWASSVGDWPELSTMREGSINSASSYVSVQAFCAGTPLLDSTQSDNDRWKTYLSTPIWMSDAFGWRHIAGVITITSMRDAKKSSVARRNRANLRRALVSMTAAGTTILDRKARS